MWLYVLRIYKNDLTICSAIHIKYNKAKMIFCVKFTLENNVFELIIIFFLILDEDRSLRNTYPLILYQNFIVFYCLIYESSNIKILIK